MGAGVTGDSRHLAAKKTIRGDLQAEQSQNRRGIHRAYQLSICVHIYIYIYIYIYVCVRVRMYTLW